MAEEGAKAEAQKFTDDSRMKNRSAAEKRRTRIQAVMAEFRESKAQRLRAPETDGLAGAYLSKGDIMTPRHGPMTPAPSAFPDLFPEEKATDSGAGWTCEQCTCENAAGQTECAQCKAPRDKVVAIMEKADKVALSTYAQAKMMGDAGYVMFDLVVSGAGSPQANGLYEPAQPSSNYPQWTMCTQKQSWCIYWKKCRTPRGKRQKGECVMLNKKEATIYYKNGPFVPNEADKVPPEGGWKKNRDAGKISKDPAPSITFRERKSAMKV